MCSPSGAAPGKPDYIFHCRCTPNALHDYYTTFRAHSTPSVLSELDSMLPQLALFAAWALLPPLVTAWNFRLPLLGQAKDETLAAVAPVRVFLQKQYVPVSRHGVVVAYKTAHFGELSVGSPPQNLRVVFDTGSGHLVLPSSRCRTETCAKHRRFDSNASATAREIYADGTALPAVGHDIAERDQVAISFGTGRVVGDVVRERACFGAGAGAGAASLCASVRMVLANEMSSEPFGLFAFDGVLGLGLEALTLDPHFSFFGQLSSQHPGLLPRFAVYLARDADDRSFISMGGHYPEHASSEFQWSPVCMPELGYWQVRLLAVRVGSQSLVKCAPGECRAILDTGSSLLGAPRAVLRDLQGRLSRALPGTAAASSVDCRSVPGPPLHFDLEGGGTVTLTHEDYSRPAPTNGTWTLAEGRRLLCKSSLLPLDMKPPLGPKVFVWGEPVLRKHYTVYDWGAKRIGMALARRPPPGGPPGRPPGGPPGGDRGAAASHVGVPPLGTLVNGAPLPVRS